MPRYLLLWSREKGEWDTEEASPEMCRKMWRSARSRSPRERSAPRAADGAGELLIEEYLGLFNSTCFRTNTAKNNSRGKCELDSAERQEAKPRGRPRKRRFSLKGERDGKDPGRSGLRRKMLVLISN